MTRILPALRIVLFALLAPASALITGCGLKGDLILPEPADASSESAPQQADDEKVQDAEERRQ
jgi:predicted small lipoprotein YifL